jgi:hypothetical protein
MRWIALLALSMLTAGCGESATAKRSADRRADESAARVVVERYFADLLAGRAAPACARLSDAYRRKLGGSCTAAHAHAMNGLSPLVRQMVRIRVLRVTVRGDRSAATLEPKRWAGENPTPIELVRTGDRWLIDGGGVPEDSATPYSQCVVSLDAEFRADDDPGIFGRFADGTMREFLDRVCTKLADSGAGLTDDAAIRNAAGETIARMRAEGRIKLRD